MIDFYCHHDLSDDPECVEQCGRCWEIQRLSAENKVLAESLLEAMEWNWMDDTRFSGMVPPT